MQIIAEIGSNFETFDDCMHGIAEASSAKATAVKFQYFSHYDLYGFGSTETKLKKEWLLALSDLTHKFGMKFGVSAFSQEGINVVSPYVDFYKIASAENLMKLEYPRKIPKIVSTGGLELSEIPLLVEAHNLSDGDCIMYCVASYPAKYEEYSLINLCSIELLLDDTGIDIGLSDHTVTNRFATESSSSFNLKWLEKHFRPERTRCDAPDFPHSIDHDTFKAMVESIREAEDGKIPYYMPKAEIEFREKHRRRFIEIDGVNKFVRPK